MMLRFCSEEQEDQRGHFLRWATDVSSTVRDSGFHILSGRCLLDIWVHQAGGRLSVC